MADPHGNPQKDAEKVVVESKAPFIFATLAALCFALMEAGVEPVSLSFSVAPILLIRAYLAFPLLAAFILIFGARLTKPVKFSCLRKIDALTWIRGLICAGCTAFMTLALAANETQTFTYALFLIHPLITMGLTKFFTRKHPDYVSQIVPVLMTTCAAVAYVILDAKGGQSDGSGIFFQYVAPSVAGILFALENLLANKIKADCKIDGITLAFQTSLTGLFFTPISAVIVCFFMAKITGWAPSGDFTKSVAHLIQLQGRTEFHDLVKVAILIGASLAGTAGGTFITKAFTDAKPGQVPTVAMLDLLVLIFAAVIGLASSNVTLLDGPHALFNLKGFMLALIFAGACLSVYNLKQPESERRNEKSRYRWGRAIRLCGLLLIAIILV